MTPPNAGSVRAENRESRYWIVNKGGRARPPLKRGRHRGNRKYGPGKVNVTAALRRGIHWVSTCTVKILGLNIHQPQVWSSPSMSLREEQLL